MLSQIDSKIGKTVGTPGETHENTLPRVEIGEGYFLYFETQSTPGGIKETVLASMPCMILVSYCRSRDT